MRREGWTLLFSPLPRCDEPATHVRASPPPSPELLGRHPVFSIMSVPHESPQSIMLVILS